MGCNADYLSCLNSFGAAQLDAQWARWKTVTLLARLEIPVLANTVNGRPRCSRLTFFHTVLICLAIILFHLACHTLCTLIEVMLGGCALLRAGAL